MPFLLANWRFIVPALMAIVLGYYMIANANLRTKLADAETEKQRVLKEAAEKVITLKEQDAAHTRAWLESWLSQRNQLEQDYLDAKTRLAATAASTVCTTSPAGRAFIDGVWEQGRNARPDTGPRPPTR